MKIFKRSVVAVALALVGMAGPAAPAQQMATATVHGKVNNAAGIPLASGTVEFTKDKFVAEKDQKMVNTAPIDASGNYSATGIAPGDYLVWVRYEGKHMDRLELTVKAGDNKTLDFDMTRAEYIKSLTPEERKTIEEYKKKNAEVTSANVVIGQLNATLKTVRADLTAAAPAKGDVSADVASMKQATDAKGDVGLLWLTYGDTLQAQGDHLAYEDKKAGKPAMSDETVLKTYSDAVDAYKKGVDLDGAAKRPNPVEQAVGYGQMGNALAKTGKTSEAAAAIESAVKLDPSKAGFYYNNESVVLYNAGQGDAALAAADKAIAAEPTRPDPYYIKGQALIAKSAFDNKTQKLVPPPGCVEAYQKYLELSPEGPHAKDVQDVLGSLGEKINTKYKAGKK